MSPEIPPYDEAPAEGNAAAVSEIPEPLPPRPAAAPASAGRREWSRSRAR